MRSSTPSCWCASIAQASSSIEPPKPSPGSSPGADLVPAAGHGHLLPTHQGADDGDGLLEPAGAVVGRIPERLVLRSGSYQPAPSPRMSRPPLTASAVVAILASSAGCRNEVQVTSWPSSRRRVDAASVARIVQPSKMPSSDGPTADGRTPTASAGRPPRRVGPKVRTCGQVGIRPGPSDNDVGTTTPIRMSPSLRVQGPESAVVEGEEAAP